MNSDDIMKRGEPERESIRGRAGSRNKSGTMGGMHAAAFFVDSRAAGLGKGWKYPAPRILREKHDLVAHSDGREFAAGSFDKSARSMLDRIAGSFADPQTWDCSSRHCNEFACAATQSFSSSTWVAEAMMRLLLSSIYSAIDFLFNYQQIVWAEYLREASSWTQRRAPSSAARTGA